MVDVTEKIRKLVIIGLVMDDDLMGKLVLKGGNAIAIAYHDASNRASLDLDFSMENNFQEDEKEKIKSVIQKNLETTFEENGYKIIDFKFEAKPEKIAPHLKDFWGGYSITFKVLTNESFLKHQSDLRQLRLNALNTDPSHNKSFSIDISPYEYTAGKEPYDVEGYTIFVYTPLMIVLEKMRAICQQVPEYGPIINTMKRRPRAKDFFDIYTIMQKFPDIDVTSEKSIDILKNIFEVKRVPIDFLMKMKEQREFHRPDFESVKTTVTAGTVVESFDFYFDFVVGLVHKIQSVIKTL